MCAHGIRVDYTVQNVYYNELFGVVPEDDRRSARRDTASTITGSRITIMVQSGTFHMPLLFPGLFAYTSRRGCGSLGGASVCMSINVEISQLKVVYNSSFVAIGLK